MTDHDVGRLVHVEAIKVLKARYFRAVDTKDWTLLGELFLPEATLESGGRTRNGRDEIVRTISGVLDPVVAVHHGYTPEISVTGIGLDSRLSATGIWAMDDYLEWSEQSARRGAPVGFRGYGHYHDRYGFDDDGRWRFESVVLTRRRVDPLPGGMPER